MISSQFDTTSDGRTGGGNTLAYLVETIDDKGTGWSLEVWREGATRGEYAIMWSTGDIDVTMSPEEFLRWQGDSWVQIMWSTTGKKGFARIGEVRWKTTNSCYTVCLG